MRMQNDVGRRGEEYAAKILKGNGYKILSKNYNTRYGEVDIIALKQDILAFVEVKTRADGSLVSPCEAVTIAKQKKLLMTASIYLARYSLDLQPRFDVFEVVTAKTENFKVVSHRHIESAFEVNDLNRVSNN